MAESTVTFFVEKLGNLILQEASLFGQVEGQVKLLRNELEWMRLFLKDADSKRIYDERVKLWVDQIRSATHDAEDAIDEFILNMDCRRKRLDAVKLLKCLPTCVGFADKLPFIHELDSRVKDINLLIVTIMANRSKYGLESLWASQTSTNELTLREEKRPPVVEESEAVGIEDGEATVKEMLMKSETLRTVLSIVGMGGLGKTTLAKKVYNQRDVQQHFDCKAWVYVSQKFRAKEILLDIALSLRCVEKEEAKNMGELELGPKLCNYLVDKKYLVVMDDVWSNEVWRSMSSFFPEAIKGSKVLITTRNTEVALDASTSQTFIYELRFMKDHESWRLFLKKVFQGISAPFPLTRGLEPLGKEIVAKCKDLPLAIVVLGGLLSTKEKSRASWEKVLASMEGHLNGGPESCMGFLALSYDDLPYYLKSFFLYCGVFPEDYEISASKLIHLWIAEGFVQRRGKEIPEDIAEDYIQELIHRNLIQVAGRGPDGRVESCRMHNLLRDLAVLEAKDAKFFEVHKNLDLASPSSVRRLVIHENPIESISQCLHNSQLRSLLLFREPMGENDWGSLLEHIKLLTVLDLGSIDRKYKIPREIGQLVRLKFLSIDGTHVVKIPSSIGNLVNLQCLDLGWCETHIPNSIWNLHQLRHLRCWGCKFSSQSKIRKCVNGNLGAEQLTNLQTLSLPAGSWLEGDALGKLTQLRELSLEELSAPYLKKGFFDSISKLTLLRTLNLELSTGREHSRKKTLFSHLGSEWQKNGIIGEDDAKLLPGLEDFSSHADLYHVWFGGKLEKLPEQIHQFYPPNLVQLTLSECELKDDPNIILEKLPLLRILTFYDSVYVGKKMVYSSGGFPRLESLTLYGLHQLEEVIIEKEALSCLKDLEISQCNSMTRLPQGWSHLTNLETLSCKGRSCSESIKEIKEAEGEDWDKLSKILVD